MPQFLANVGKRGMRMQVIVDEPDQAAMMITAIKKRLKNVRPVFRAWKSLFQKTVEQRFDSAGGTKGWKSLSCLSTWPLRHFRDITRVKDAGGMPRLGGRPVEIMRSAYREYMKSWTSDRHSDLTFTEQIDATTGDGAVMRLSNTNIKTVHEEGIKRVKGPIGFRGKRVPARPATYLRGDERLLFKMMMVFNGFILEGLRKAGGNAGSTTMNALSGAAAAGASGAI